MGTDTDDGFIIESEVGDIGVKRIIVLALDEAEALQIAEHEHPGSEHRIVQSGSDVRAQAARLGVEPGTSVPI